ncbi:MAG TPA: hypothetical protein VIP70_08435 [Nitrososphaeraceae archaeon]
MINSVLYTKVINILGIILTTIIIGAAIANGITLVDNDLQLKCCP